MKYKLSLLFVTVALIGFCQKNGQLTGVNGDWKKVHKAMSKIGMVHIPSGSIYTKDKDSLSYYMNSLDFNYDITPRDADIGLLSNNSRITSVQSYFMGKYEVTNREYKQFVDYVVDSNYRVALGLPYVKGAEDSLVINSSLTLDLKDQSVQDKLVASGLAIRETLNGETILVPVKSKINFRYRHLRINTSYRSYTEEGVKDTIDYSPGKLILSSDKYAIIEYEINPFPKSELFNVIDSVLARDYFSLKAFENYPVTCVTQMQAEGYCKWFTEEHHDLSSVIGDFRLPHEMEWEYAAFYDNESPMYGWQGINVNSEKGEYFGNFFPGDDVINKDQLAKKLFSSFQYKGSPLSTKNYNKTSYGFMLPVDAYKPNSAGVYNLSGNVSEMLVANSRINYPYGFRDVILKGGSYLDPIYYSEINTRQIADQKSAAYDRGFRVVCTYYQGGVRNF
jgi:formylglycine-generating enzyme required for sulfatase activity